MVFGLLFGGGPVQFFSNAVLRFFARISYSLYLVHLPLVPLAMVLTRSLGNGEASFHTFFPIFVMLSIMAALVLHFAVEKPFLILKDRKSIHDSRDMAYVATKS